MSWSWWYLHSSRKATNIGIEEWVIYYSRCCEKIPAKINLRFWLTVWSDSPAWQEDMVAGAWGRQSHQVCNQDIGRNECWPSESQTPAHGMVLSAFRVDLLFSGNRHTLVDTTQSLFPWWFKILSCWRWRLNTKWSSRSGEGKVELWAFESGTEEEEQEIGNKKQAEKKALQSVQACTPWGSLLQGRREGEWQ